VNWRDVSNYICFVVKGTKLYAFTLMFVLSQKLIGSRRLLDLKTISDHIALGACWETANDHIAVGACWICRRLLTISPSVLVGRRPMIISLSGLAGSVEDY